MDKAIGSRVKRMDGPRPAFRWLPRRASKLPRELALHAVCRPDNRHHRPLHDAAVGQEFEPPAAAGEVVAHRIGAEHAEDTLEHIGRAPMFSMEKARALLGFVPQHSVTDTVLEAIDAWVATRR